MGTLPRIRSTRRRRRLADLGGDAREAIGNDPRRVGHTGPIGAMHRLESAPKSETAMTARQLDVTERVVLHPGLQWSGEEARQGP